MKTTIAYATWDDFDQPTVVGAGPDVASATSSALMTLALSRLLAGSYLSYKEFDLTDEENKNVHRAIGAAITKIRANTIPAEQQQG